MKKPYVDGLEWGLQEDYLSATRMLRTEGSFRPYLQVRGGRARLHPRSHLFDQRPLPEGFVLGDSPTSRISIKPGATYSFNEIKLNMDEEKS